MKKDITTSQRSAHNSGYTLTEVIVASGLLAIAVTAIFAAAITAIRTQNTASNLYHATCLARNRIQRGLSLPFDSLTVLEETNQPIDEDGNPNIIGPYERSTTLVAISSNCYHISSTVLYPIGKGDIAEVPVTVESKIARGMHSEVVIE